MLIELVRAAWSVVSVVSMVTSVRPVVLYFICTTNKTCGHILSTIHQPCHFWASF